MNWTPAVFELSSASGFPYNPDWVAFGLASAYFIVPILLGALLGITLRRLRGRRMESRVVPPALVLASLAAPFVVPGRLLFLGIWDLALLSLLASGGLVLTGHVFGQRIRRAELTVLLVSSLLGATVLEMGYGLLEPDGQRYFPLAATDVRLVVDPLWINGCDAAEDSLLPFPEYFPEILEERLPHGPERKFKVLHVGDSMIFGYPTRDSLTYVGMVNEEDDQASHINAGLPDTGTDHQYLVAAKWTEFLDVDAVVVHLNPLGDVLDMDRSRCFCDDGPILSYAEGKAELNCRKAVFETSYWLRFQQSPLPYFLRVLAQSSAAARGLCSAFARAQDDRELTPVRATQALSHVVAALEAMRDELEARGVEFQVVYVPDRSIVVRSAQNGGSRDRQLVSMKALLEERGITVLDPFEAFLAAYGAAPDEDWFVRAVPDDIHFAPAGHRFMAEWLKRNLVFSWTDR